MLFRAGRTRPSPAPDTITTSSDALAQRLIRLRDDADLQELTECGGRGCGLLVAALPRPVLVTRSYVVRLRGTRITRVFPGFHTLRYAHVTRPDGRAACAGCFEDPEACQEDHTPHMCDLPTFLPCARCHDPVQPGQETCRDCTPTEETWDKDHYLNL